ncbi:MAG: hypothetical protein RL682_1635 [Pseudomonadota bacterium]|jgi:tripartite-type tricarboxylate transporter receptor subunit TctC
MISVKSNTFLRRRQILALAAAALPLKTGWAAETYPSKPMRIIVAFPPGGATDLMARTIAARLQVAWGQPVTVENKPGASGIIGTDLVAKSAPDGYTLVMATQTTHSVNPGLFAKLPYDSVKDFAPITQAGFTPLVLVVPKALGVNTLGELVAYLKANLGKGTFGSGGSGTSQHLSAELFKTVAGVDVIHVPYKGSAPAMTDLLGGQLTMMFDNLPTALPHIRSGKLTALAVTSLNRSSIAPDIPTMAQSGLTGFETITWFGLLAPTGMPAERIAKVHDEVARQLHLPEVTEKLMAAGVEVLANTPAQFATQLQADIAKWAKVIRTSGAKAV